MSVVAFLRENQYITIVGISVFVVILIVIVVAIILQQGSEPGNCVERINEETGETVIHCPNRDPEAYEPEKDVKQQTLNRIEDALPIYKERYEIDFEYPETGEGTVPIVIRVISREIPPPPDDAPSDSKQVREYKDYIRKHRQRAHDRLEDIAVKRSEYRVYYAEDYLIDEFSGSYWGDRK